MAINLTLSFPVTGNRSQIESYFSGVHSPVPGWKEKNTFERDKFELELMPFTEPIEGSWLGNRLFVQVKTNFGGPGYHAYVVDMLDGLGIEPEVTSDDTGYYDKRDFAELQNQMGKYLEIIARSLIGSDIPQYGTRAMHIRADSIRYGAAKGSVDCPLGPLDMDFFKRVTKGERLGEQFYIWWHRELDQRFYLSCALYQIWCNVNWLHPETDEEREILSSTLSCLAKAYELDRSLNYPAAEWSEIADLANRKSLKLKIAKWFGEVGPGTLGYRRNLIIYRFSDWVFAHKGKMHFRMIKDDGYDVSFFWDEDYTIRVSLQKFFNSDGSVPSSETALGIKLSGSSKHEKVKLEDKNILAAATHERVAANGKNVWESSLYAALKGTMFMLNIQYQKPEIRAVAREIFSTVINVGYSKN
ncbi:MAG: hypothetical protein LBT59_12135 [Clostridiales bacterium]|jgi:hypothetical protein|nr:hypothetical protein [Clostridiales bacterium]